jgi:tetratricopeptide (TPR) repeat protein
MPSGDRADDDLILRLEQREKHRGRVFVLLVAAVAAITAVLLVIVSRTAVRSQHAVAVADTLSQRVQAQTNRADSLQHLRQLRDSSNAVANAGALLAMQGRTQEAHRRYQEAIRIDPTNWQAFDLEGTLDRRTHPDRAIPNLRKSIELNPGNPWAYYNLSIALWQSGAHDAALDTLSMAVRLDNTFKKTVAQDAQFAAFRDSPRFQKMIQEGL